MHIYIYIYIYIYIRKRKEVLASSPSGDEDDSADPEANRFAPCSRSIIVDSHDLENSLSVHTATYRALFVER